MAVHCHWRVRSSITYLAPGCPLRAWHRSTRCPASRAGCLARGAGAVNDSSAWKRSLPAGFGCGGPVDEEPAEPGGVQFRHAGSVREWSRTKRRNEADATENVASEDDAADVVVAPLPYPVPPRRYGPADAPWTVDTVHAEPDCFGRTWPPPAL